ncbi:MAG TPA: PP2C family serine/threonine-protein phosphatase [Pirellulales bacterium]|nr:PP2C family serine/threonine-protein phosphatase [Pirellulales bacterium]
MSLSADRMAQESATWETYVEHAALSDIGLRRSNNQDSFTVVPAKSAQLWNERGHLFMVADGMGAHAAGELASKMACDAVPLTYQKVLDEPPPLAIRKAIEDANGRIHSRGQANLDFRGMGTTTSVLLLLPQGALAAHVGDSRVYRLRGNRIEQLSFDHSLVWEMMATGKLREEEVPGYIPKNIITRSLGPAPHVEVDLEGPWPVAPGDTFLLCSDGLSGQVADDEMGAILTAFSPAEAVQVLVDLANLRGGPDNITVIVARVKTAPPPPTTNWPASGKTSRRPIHPLMWGGLGVLALATVLVGLARLPGVAAAMLLFTIITGVTMLVRAFGGQGGQLEGLRFGRGPYNPRAVVINNEFVDKLARFVAELRNAAVEAHYTVDWHHFNHLDARALAAAERKDYLTAVREYGHALSFMMSEIRGQRQKKGGTSSPGAA